MRTRLTQPSAKMTDTVPVEMPPAPDGDTTVSAVQHTEPIEARHQVPLQEQPTAEPSLERPTKEFLDKNYLKSDLQKRCRK